MSQHLDVESANTLLQKVQEGLVKVGNSVQGGVSKEAFLQEIWSCVHCTTDVKRCHLVCEAATAACTCSEDLANAEVEAEAEAEAEEEEPAAEEEEAVDETPATEDCGCPSDFQETDGFVPETVASDIPETYPLQYMICGPSLYPEDPDCSCGGNDQGTDWRIIPPKPCPQCEGKKICLVCNGAGLKAAKKDCEACSKKKGKCPTCLGEKFIKCNAKGCVKGNLTRPRKCELCGGRGQMMVWDGKMAFFFNQNPVWTERIKFRGLTVEPKVWGPIAGKCESDHGCFYGLKSSFKGEYKADPTGQYPLGIMEVVVDTGKKCGNGTRYVKFLGKLKKSGKDTLKWCKDGSLYGDDERTGYFRGGWIELFQTWAPCEICGTSKTPGYVGTEEVDCPDCEGGKKPCPKCKKLPGALAAYLEG
ncbi:unnamed protein product [Symbiodinium sp. CCMP2592]|nr:unnamed protein product [Symbiodinium sp. CCMP2592]